MVGATLSDEGDPVAGTFILQPYERRREPSAGKRLVIGIGLILLAAFYGIMCSIMPMRFVIIPAIPILVMLGLILWMLPDVGGMPYDRLRTLMLWFLAVNILWPNYVAMNLPGLPWITPTRVIVFSMVAIFVYTLATSGEFRQRIIDGMNAEPHLRTLYWVFWATTVFAIVFSKYPIMSIKSFLNNQIYWTMFLALSTLLAMRRNFMMPAARIIAATMIIVALLGIYEYSIQRVFWLDHLPQWLKADEELLAIAGETQARAGTGLYRVRGTFLASLYFAEYASMAFPFILHFLFRSKSFLSFVLLLAGAFACATAMYLTNARSGMIGLLLSLVLYGFFSAWRVRSQRENSLEASAVVFGYPAAMIILMGVVLSWNRLRVAVIGGGQNTSSDNARQAQWEMGMPKALTHPFGHGPGRSGAVLSYTNRGGEGTIDSYLLSVLLDYGFIGLASFLALFLLAVWAGFKLFQKSRTEEEQLVGPVTMALFNYIVIKAVLSSEGNMGVAFILMGCLFGLSWQSRQAEAGAKIAVEARAGPAPPGSRQPGLPAPA